MHGFGGVEDAPMERPMPATLLGGGDRT
jgi:hypothetical protein